jgi:putative methionine-R-sulfoxide reductase with GAF domain
MPGFTEPEDRWPSASNEDAIASTDQVSGGDGLGTPSDPSIGSHTLEETELGSVLQLLVERAQYITGATGTALALPQDGEMVCRASSGSSAPAVGARLQVRSGLTGESIARRQLLRCDNAETDARVNLEACRALGIASIVVLPLLRRNGEVRGLFELFSDHPYAFEERDLIALERMADLTLTALDLAEQRPSPGSAPAPRPEAEKPAEPAATSGAPTREPNHAVATAGKDRTGNRAAENEASSAADSVAGGVANHAPTDEARIAAIPVPSQFAEQRPAEVSGISLPSVSVPAAEVPDAMLRVQKCASCGFPVSEGRTLCLDCEKKEAQKKQEQIKVREQNHDASSGSESGQEEFVPAFLINAGSAEESWLANHVNLLAIAVLILGILVVVVVFR